MLRGEAPLKEPMPDYALHIEQENRYLASKSFARDKEYWKAMLKDIHPAEAKEHPYAQVSPVGIRRSFAVSNRMNRMIAGFCREKKVSPFAVFYMALAIYLRRIKGQERFCIGIAVGDQQFPDEIPDPCSLKKGRRITVNTNAAAAGIPSLAKRYPSFPRTVTNRYPAIWSSTSSSMTIAAA